MAQQEVPELNKWKWAKVNAQWFLYQNVAMDDTEAQNILITDSVTVHKANGSTSDVVVENYTGPMKNPANPEYGIMFAYPRPRGQ